MRQHQPPTAHSLKTRVVAVVIAVLAIAMLAVPLATSASGAPGAPVPPFDKNLVMANSVFDNASTMSVAQIQAFLNQFPNSCIKSYQGPLPTGKDSYGANASAAQIIYASAHLWGLNPQVILATLEKEQSLVSGGGGCASWRFWSAMGYGCPDGSNRYDYPDIGVTGTCVRYKSWVGFSAQVNHGSWQLQFNRQRAEGNIHWNDDGDIPNYGFNTKGYRQQTASSGLTYYDGYYPIDGQSVYMTNGATASLYTYTPHFGGNQAFYSLFTNWFGSAMAVRADQTDYVKGVYRVLLGRPADAGGVQFWTTYLNNGGDYGYFLRQIVSGQEYTKRTVAADYLQVLKRAGDSSGISYWAGQLSSSGRNDLIVATLAGSDEYFAGRSSSDIPTFVSNLYIDLLGRSIDGEGLAYWSDQISSKQMSRSALALSIADSPESAVKLVNSAYNLVLGRDGDAAGIEYWANRYQNSHDLLALIISLASSAEGQGHLAAPV